MALQHLVVHCNAVFFLTMYLPPTHFHQVQTQGNCKVLGNYLPTTHFHQVQTQANSKVQGNYLPPTHFHQVQTRGNSKVQGNYLLTTHFHQVQTQGNSKVQGNYLPKPICTKSKLRVTPEFRVIPHFRVTFDFRVTKKTPSKINKNIYHFSYTIELNTPAHPVGRSGFIKKVIFFSMSKKSMKLLMLSILFPKPLAILLNQTLFHW